MTFSTNTKTRVFDFGTTYKKRQDSATFNQDFATFVMLTEECQTIIF